MIGLVRLKKDGEEVGIFVKVRGGYKFIEISSKISTFRDVEEVPLTLDYHSGELKEEGKLGNYLG